IVMDNGGGSGLFAQPRGGRGGPAGNNLVAPNATAAANPAPGVAARATTPGNAAPAGGAPARGPGGRGPGLNFSEFENILLKDIIPTIDTHYRTLADREHRGMAGLSMGGMQTRNIGLAHLDTFSHI